MRTKNAYYDERICPVCGSKFIATSKNKNKRYCSFKCSCDAMKKFNYDPNNIPKCSFCGKELTHRDAQIGRKYCSETCFRSYRQREIDERIKSNPCAVCGKLMTYDQVRNGCVTCSPKCAYQYRKEKYGIPSGFGSTSPEIRKENSDRMKRLWEDPEFRESVSARMISNNPSKNQDTINKIRQTKEQRGLSNVWCGIRGGNGHISDAERALFDRLSDFGFEYNRAINTRDARIAFPDKHYSMSYKPDFTNFDAMLCVEIDGKSHRTKRGAELDRKKENCLKFLGYRVIRFTNNDVIDDTERVLSVILEEMRNQNG